ncbi:M1 family metallopeptidase, partial [Streptomyces sp. NPDC056405]|uniref:M1 family metallopeptidase n=1 Tax=Streptomyces sp. NPDC056405 TaxID=3345811 RepID=UPI0035D8C505
MLSSCTSGGTAVKGAAGGGGLADPLFPALGNGGYRVSHYGLDLDYDVAERHLDGSAAITAKAGAALRSFQLDLQGMTVTDVRVDGRAAEFSRKGHKLVVRPAAAIGKGETFRTTVSYRGTPQEMRDADGAVEGWVKTADGAFVAGEPAGSMTWFPGNNHPSDKAAYDFRITVPERYTAVANGQLRSKRTTGGRTTYEWHSAEPMASYLATATIGTFDVQESRTPQGLPIYVAVDPKEAAASRKPLSRLPEILAWAAELFGPYPFASAGAIVDHTPDRVDWGALETQTKPVYAGAPDTATVVHETAHQWFGDSVSVRQWKDIWLNEGFATYAQWLWSEHRGTTTAHDAFRKAYRAAPADDAFWKIKVSDPQRDTMFSDAVYERGAMALQALRERIGDRAFFRLLPAWTARHRYGNADTADVIALAEKVSGQRLGDLFHTWLDTQSRPALPGE